MIEFGLGTWTSDDPHKADLLSKMNEHSASGCELLECSGPSV